MNRRDRRAPGLRSVEMTGEHRLSRAPASTAETAGAGSQPTAHYLLERDDGGPESLNLEQIRLLNSAGR